MEIFRKYKKNVRLQFDLHWVALLSRRKNQNIEEMSWIFFLCVISKVKVQYFIWLLKD